MASKLVFTQAGRYEERLLQGPKVTLGRDPTNGVVLDDEKMSVSRLHAQLVFDGRSWRIVDTQSRNGVRVNNEMIERGEAGARVLNDGDSIVLGEFPLQFVLEESGLVLEDEKRAEPGVTSQTAARRLRDLPGLIGSGAALPKEAQEVVERARRALAVVTTLGQRIAAVTPIDEIITAILELVFETTPAERAGLFLWDADAQRLVPKRSRARDGSHTGDMHVSESLVKQAFAARASVQMDPGNEPSASMSRLRLRSAIAVPLLDESKAVGVIYADSSLRSGAFDSFGVSLLSALANHAAIALEQSRLLRRIRREEFQRTKLERFLARGVVDRILATGESSPGISMQAEEAEVTVLFCDMAGFTERSEGLAPHDVLTLLNRYFGQMTEVILEHEGTLDKYIGDCIMAVFGAPQPQPDHARRAARAALGMRGAIQKVNAEVSPDKKVEFRVGIHSGRVIAGDVGHVTRRDWTVIGSTVNLASRLESSVAQRNQIVLSGETRALLGAEFELRQLAITKPPKGISRSFEAFELVGQNFEWDWSRRRP